MRTTGRGDVSWSTAALTAAKRSGRQRKCEGACHEDETPEADHDPQDAPTALRTRTEVYFRVLGPQAAIERKLSCVTRIYEAQHPEHWRGCTMVGFPRKCAREAMRELRAARVFVLPIGHRSRYIRSLADEWRIIEEQS